MPSPRPPRPFIPSLRSKIGAGLVAALLILVVGAISVYSVQRASNSSALVEKTGRVLLEQEQLLSALKDVQSGSRSFVAIGKDEFLGPYDTAVKEVSASLARLRRMTADNPLQQQRLDTLESVARERVELSDQIILIRRTQGFEMARLLLGTGQSTMVMDHARALLEMMEAEERALLARRTADLRADQRLAVIVIAVGSFMAFLISLLINRSIRRDVIDREAQQKLIERQSSKLQKQSNTLETQQSVLARQLAEQQALASQNSALLNSTEAGFYGMNPKGECTFINRAGAAMLGYAPDALVGRDMHATIHHHRADGSAYPLAECTMNSASRTGQSARNDEEVFWRNDGTAMPVEYSTSPIQENGELRGAVVAFADISARKRADRIVAESEERKAAVLRSTLDSIISIDADGIVFEFNRAAQETFGYTYEEAIGKPLGDLIVPERLREAHRAGMGRYLNTGTAHILGKRLELPAMRRDGTEFPSELTITRTDIDGTPAFIGVLRDITARKKADAEREQLIAALARSNQELDQFAYVASHDLKAPLRGIANLSQWIEEDLGGALNGESKSQMEMLRGRVHRMEALIDGILQYSRAGRVRARPEAVDTGLLVAEVIDLLAPGPNVVTDVIPGMPVVNTERVPLQQVLLNLIGNAIKHTGRIDPVISIRWADAGELVEFTVSDNGQGIAPQYHDRIFAIFHTLEARDKVEGTGIGLSVVKKMVESKGGRVWLESDVGLGSTFHFTWPRNEVTEE
ncbi:MAG: PAS domain S-box protein [Gemmatimonadaceae bacterium]